MELEGFKKQRSDYRSAIVVPDLKESLVVVYDRTAAMFALGNRALIHGFSQETAEQAESIDDLGERFKRSPDAPNEYWTSSGTLEELASGRHIRFSGKLWEYMPAGNRSKYKRR
jgi:hypothetical protein